MPQPDGLAEQSYELPRVHDRRKRLYRYRHVQVSVYHDGLFIPNAFTPGNKDNLNNTWKISDYGVKTFEVTVFDRWGSKLYATDNIYEGRMAKWPTAICIKAAYMCTKHTSPILTAKNKR